MNLMFYKKAIYQFIRDRVKKFPKIFYFVRVWRYRNDNEFVSRVMEINRNPNIIELKSFGEKNQEKNIYFIDLGGDKGAGLGAYLRQTLYGLFEADRLGFIPVIFYQPQGCLYAEAEKVNGTDNPFEYYFKKTSDISIEEVYESARVFLYNPCHSLRVEHELGNLTTEGFAGYFVNDVYTEKMAHVWKKYIRLNEIVRNKIHDDMRQLTLDKWERRKILGVHIRGTDYALNWENHPNMVTAEEYIKAIDEIFLKYDYQYIFLATDDKRCLAALCKKYGEKLIYYKDVARGERALNIAMEKNDRPMHHYLNGLEVVRDMYTLARCDSLVCGLSQVSTLARTIRLAEQGPYTYLKVLDKGIYQG